MRIVITGASGFLGTQLVPRLQQQGIELLLVGRDPAALGRLFPQNRVAGYEDLATAAQGYDVVLHLAVRNNDQPGSLEDFRAANVTLLETVAQAARAAGVATFINVTSLQARPDETASPYARSKAEGEARLAGIPGLRVVNLRLPAVYGTEYRGKLAILAKVPGILRPLAFQTLAALKPTVHIDRVTQAVTEAAAGRVQGTRIVSDAQIGNLVFLVVKRTIDIAFVAFVVVVLWWVLLGAWIAVRLTSPGPAIFAQQRIGRHQVPFTFYKFRTMHLGTRQAGTHELSASAITKVGAFLRKTKIDEFPQVWNMLVNDLSLVGPRPGLPVQTELTAARAARGVYDILPGITGWAQIQNIDMSDPQRLAEVDAEYIALRSLPMELKILLATATGSGQGDKVRS